MDHVILEPSRSDRCFVFGISQIMLRLIPVFLIFLTVAGCTKFKEGDSIQHSKDGFIWRIIAVQFNKYKTLLGWFDGKWGLSVDVLPDDFNPDDGRYVKISCPMSTEVLREVN